MKRYSLFIFCVLLCLSLAACKKPVGSTPYESTDSYVSSDVESDEQSSSLESDSSQLPQGDSSNSTTKGTTSKNTTTKSGSDNEVELDWGEPEPTVVTDSKGSTVTDKNGDAVTVTTTTTTTVATTTTTKPTQQEEIKGVSLPKKGTILHYQADGKTPNIQLDSITVDKNQKVIAVIKNVTTKWESDQTSYLEYICYDDDSKVLTTGKSNFGRIDPQKTFTCEFTVPKETKKVELKCKAEMWSDGWK